MTFAKRRHDVSNYIPPLSFGKSFMKIHSAVPENGCLIFFADEKKQKNAKTRMIQLPATAAIAYVAACCRTRTRTRTRTKTGTKTKFGTITKTVRGPYARSPKFNTYTHRLGFLCLAT